MRTDNSFEGNVAVVTGAGRGLGRDYAKYLAARGAQLVVNDYGGQLSGEGCSSAPADEVVSEIARAGGEAIPNYDGVHESAGAEALIETALSHFGRVDILICNAGIWSCQKLVEADVEQWNRMIAVHLGGTMMTARAALPHMQRNGYGRLVFTSSSGGLYGKAGLTAYGAAKGGIYGLTRCLALELAETKTDMVVNAVLPGAQTRMISSSTATLWADRPGFADPALVSPLVAYLASRECSANGNAYSAGAGYFARDEAMQGQGIRLLTDRRITHEDIARNWNRIDDLSAPSRFRDVMDYGARMFDIKD